MTSRASGTTSCKVCACELRGGDGAADGGLADASGWRVRACVYGAASPMQQARAQLPPMGTQPFAT